MGMDDESEVPLIEANGYHTHRNDVNGSIHGGKTLNGVANGTSHHHQNGSLRSPSPTPKRTRNLVLFGLLGVGLFLLYYWYSRSTDKIDFSRYYRVVDSNSDCHIPRPDPWDPTILKYIEKPPVLGCKKLQTEFTYLDDNGWLMINDTARKADGYGNIACQYRCFDKSVGKDDVTNVYGKWTDFKVKAQPRCEFVEVSCSRSFPSISIYSNLHSQIVVNKTRLDQLPSGWKVGPDSSRPETKSRVTPKRPPSVLVYVLDSVSHSNARRNLPKLLKVLETDYESIVFDGYAKVGDNSFPNAAAMLTGRRVSVAGYKSELPEDMSKNFFDDWGPIIWSDFHKSGYVTLYTEDYPEYNLFKYLSNGFRGRPVDHYFRPYWVQLWSTFLHKRSSHLCYGNTPKLNLQTKYLRQFLTKYRGSPNFAFNWQVELGHDWLNQIGVGDEYLADFFHKVKPYLNDTFVFVLSDHGHRFDRIRESVIGRIEERMPMFTVSVPPWARKAYPEMIMNLRNNSQTLTSPYDLYMTLNDILETGRDWTGLGAQKNWSRFAPRGLSLFRPISKSRTCKEAGITEDFCICQHETNVNVTDPTVVRGADIVLKHINWLLKDERDKCEVLSLNHVRNAQTFLPNHNMIEDKEVSVFYGGSHPTGFYVNYRVTIETSPGNAVFEGTLRNSVSDDKLSVIGDINRINKYGNQSICVKKALLRKYCLCKLKKTK